MHKKLDVFKSHAVGTNMEMPSGKIGPNVLLVLLFGELLKRLTDFKPEVIAAICVQEMESVKEGTRKSTKPTKCLKNKME